MVFLCHGPTPNALALFFYSMPSLCLCLCLCLSLLLAPCSLLPAHHALTLLLSLSLSLILSLSRFLTRTPLINHAIISLCYPVSPFPASDVVTTGLGRFLHRPPSSHPTLNGPLDMDCEYQLNMLFVCCAIRLWSLTGFSVYVQDIYEYLSS